MIATGNVLCSSACGRKATKATDASSPVQSVRKKRTGPYNRIFESALECPFLAVDTGDHHSLIDSKYLHTRSGRHSTALADSTACAQVSPSVCERVRACHIMCVFAAAHMNALVTTVHRPIHKRSGILSAIGAEPQSTDRH
jgi:hypothetical protein